MNNKTLLFSITFALFQPGSLHAQNSFDSWDRNNDGKLVRDEVPARVRGAFDRVDTDRDGSISREEDRLFRSQLRNGRLQRPSDNIPVGTHISRDVAYLADGHQRHRLDVYSPKNPKGKRPLVVWIHGGGWQKGDKKNCPATFLLAEGYVVASINYRLSHHAIFPAQIQDCKAAIRWLRTNAAKYSIDPQRIGAWGSSAGGHLVALLGTSGNVQELERDNAAMNVSSKVQAVCDYFGPTSLLKMNQHAGQRSRIDHDAAGSPESRLLGGPLQSRVQEAKLANPIEYVSPDDPPFLILHGDRDPLVPLQQSIDLNEALQAAGVESTLVVVEGGGHGGFKEPVHFNRVRDFFNKHLQQTEALP